jgi:poly(hydroxyalkanoate) granule-associated protein
MTEQTQEMQEKAGNAANRVYEAAHKTLLAGLGAVSLAQDEIKKGYENSSEFANKLVERGEKISKERREQVTAEAEKRQEKAQEMGEEVTNRVGETYRRYSTATLHRMNIPSNDDIQDLSKQIAALNRKLDRVRKEQKELVTA